MFSFGWFSSGRDQAAIDLFAAVMDRMATGFIPGRLAYVFCDRAPGETEASDRFLAEVRDRGVPLVTQSSGKLRALIKAQAPDLSACRDAFDAQVIEQVQDYAADVAVLAGYMLIASPRLCRAFLCLNLHPAVPGGPKGTWQQVMWQVLEAGHQEAGGMMHLATPELDEGPPVTYFHLPLSGPEFEPLWADFTRKRRELSLVEIQAREGEAEPLFAKIRQEELRREFPLILLTLKNLAEGRFTLSRAGVQDEGRLLPRGVDLTGQVEEFLQSSSKSSVK
jgi:phosphoribosylglycinamide formyltransferase 1